MRLQHYIYYGIWPVCFVIRVKNLVFAYLPCNFSPFLMDISVFLFHLVLLLGLPTASIAHIKRTIQTDQSALFALKSQLFHSSNLLRKNWTANVSVCNWIGVTCSSRHHRVVSLNLSYLGLQGSIPPEIGNLSFVNSIDLSGNNFQGNLPMLVHLRRLKYISLANNNFGGEVPSGFGSLPNLQALDLSNNSFTGAIPTSLFNASKLESISFMSNQLQGNIPQEIGNLGNLKVLSMANNQLTGLIPLTLFNISSLQIVNLRNNTLSGDLPVNLCSKLSRLHGYYLAYNTLSGQILSRFDNCSELEELSLNDNDLNGTLPREIGNLTMLKLLSLGQNKFAGGIPAEIGNLQNLECLDIEGCALSGTIPKEIGNLQKLNMLNFALNTLSGQVPVTIYNISTMTFIRLTGNKLSGSLPHSIGHLLPNLETLNVAHNYLTGVIPDSISNMTKLVILELSMNRFTGSIPRSLGSLNLLETLDVAGYYLATGSPKELSIISSLANCKSLRVLILDGVSVKGTIPPTIANLSNSLEVFLVSTCELEGSIPPEIGNLSRLTGMDLSSNHFTGQLPLAFQGLSNIQALELQNNRISGAISPNFCNLRSLTLLDLSQNKFSGQLPECLGNMSSLGKLNLSSNGLNSTMPASVGSLKDLLNLDVHSNAFGGFIPQEIGNLLAAISIDLSWNKFSGNIPTTVGNLQNLINFSLAHNEIQGSFPEIVRKMVNLESLDLSQNNLTGEIPASLVSLLQLQHFNVSFNHLHGKIPENGSFLNFTIESFISNEGFCGGPAHLRLLPCPNNSPQASRTKRFPRFAYILLPTALTVFAVIIFELVLIMAQHRSRNRAQTNPLPPTTHERISYYDLVHATNDFGENNLIASGSYGSVYKGVLRDGSILAIKVFNLQVEGAFKSFDAECEVLRNIRHRNLVKVISSCSNHDFRALVLEYMPMEALKVIDVATALDYLHHGHSSPIVHCDLKPSNVLLDQAMTGHVGDFGIAKLLSGGESKAITNTLATIGYIAPEYGSEGKVSRSCDVYSFGILLMETFSRKKPTDVMFTEDCGLKDWVRHLLQNPELDLVDHNLITPSDANSTKIVQCIFKIMEMAVTCTVESPEERIDVTDALNELKNIKHEFLSK
nr:LRR receptor-like serine/threonine-protein kinase EFR [Coffea arabica]